MSYRVKEGKITGISGYNDRCQKRINGEKERRGKRMKIKNEE